MSTEERQIVIDNVNNLKAQVTSLEKLLEPISSQSLTQLTSQLTPLDAAKLYNTVAYALSTLEVCYLKLNGIDHKEHAIVSDLASVQAAMKKTTDAAKMLQVIAAENAAKQEKESAKESNKGKTMNDGDDDNTGSTNTTTNTNTKSSSSSKNTSHTNNQKTSHNVHAPGKAKKRKA